MREYSSTLVGIDSSFDQRVRENSSIKVGRNSIILEYLSRKNRQEFKHLKGVQS